eukprot:TRINITY_DN2175_c0_g1_i1.p1 TRINITY_DN2175_c0_g1~~TRINITY_DN2175_c0_g1_i1.p1  ORF type:complete len:341 (+),score=93.29 TRINITY_DN2175_c0_g1_i1:91-1113(+)
MEDISGRQLCELTGLGDFDLVLEAFTEISRLLAVVSLPFDEKLQCDRILSEFTVAGGVEKLVEILCQPEPEPGTAFVTNTTANDGFADHNARITAVASMLTVLACNKLVCRKLLADERVVPKLFWFVRRGCVDTSEPGLLSASHYCLEVLFQLGQSKRGIKQLMDNGLIPELEHALRNPPRLDGTLIDVVASAPAGQHSLVAHQPYRAHFVICLCSFLEVVQAHLETLNYNPVITEDNIIVALIELAPRYPADFDEDGCLAFVLAQIAQLCRWDQNYYRKCRVFFRQRIELFSRYLLEIRFRLTATLRWSTTGICVQRIDIPFASKPTQMRRANCIFCRK